MKSHVRENIAKQIFANSFREKKISDTESDIEFNDFISDIIKDQAPGIKFTNWHVQKKTETTPKMWSATAEDVSTHKKVDVMYPDIMDCIRHTKELLGKGTDE